MKKVSIRFRHEFPADPEAKEAMGRLSGFQFALDTNFLPTTQIQSGLGGKQCFNSL